MDKAKVKDAAHERRRRRVRGKVSGTAARPRLSVTRTNTNIYVQVIDDDAGRTLIATSSIDQGLKGSLKKGSDVEAAKAVGLAIGKLAVEAGISEVVFDRGGNLYHGRVQALADGAREAGLKL